MQQNPYYRGARRREKETEKILKEIIAKNFPTMGKEPLTQIQEAQRVPYKINPRRKTPRHTLIKLTKIKDKEKILKAAREKKQTTYKGTPIRHQQIFQLKLCRPEGSGMIILNMMKGKHLQPRLLYPSRLSSRFEGEIKTFTDKQKLREFRSSRRGAVVNESD